MIEDINEFIPCLTNGKLGTSILSVVSRFSNGKLIRSIENS